MMSHLEALLEPYDHEIKFKPPNYYIRLENALMSIGWRDVAIFEHHTYDIHHTEECLEAQKAFYEFQEFIEGFGGYVPTPTCDCPRDKIPPDPKGKAEMFFKVLLRKHHSLEETVNE